jgi:hypothetical protein
LRLPGRKKKIKTLSHKMKKEKYVTGLEDLKTWDFSGNEQSEDF